MYEYNVKEVLKIYDGDTITVIIDCGFGIYHKQVLRLYGIDTPELRGKERPEGLKSRERLVELIEKNPNFRVRTFKDKKGKYGRLLVDLIIPETGESMNQILINEGYAEAYFGGKKS